MFAGRIFPSFEYQTSIKCGKYHGGSSVNKGFFFQRYAFQFSRQPLSTHEVFTSRITGDKASKE